MRGGHAHRISLRGHVFRWVAGPMALLVLLDLLASATLAVRYASQRYDADLLDNARALAQLVSQQDDPSRLPAAARYLLTHEGHRPLYFEVLDRSGRRVAGNAPLVQGPVAGHPLTATLYDVHLPGGAARVARLPASHQNAAVVAVGEPLAPRRRQAMRLVWLATIVQLPLLLATALLAWLAVGRALGAVTALTASLDPVAPRPRLIDDRAGPTELAALTHAFHRLLARMDAARRSQERFVMNASRRLRAPLDRLRAAVAQARGCDDAAGRRAALEDVMRYNEQATRITGQLLALARVRPGHERIDRRADTDLDALLQSLVARSAIEHRGARADIGYEGPGGPLIAQVDASSIDDVLHAWIDDSLQHVSHDRCITVKLQRGADDGAQITFTDLAGTGRDGRSFALMLARRVAGLHGGQLAIGREGGARSLTLTFPAPAHALS